MLGGASLHRLDRGVGVGLNAPELRHRVRRQPAARTAAAGGGHRQRGGGRLDVGVEDVADLLVERAHVAKAGLDDREELLAIARVVALGLEGVELAESLSELRVEREAVDEDRLGRCLLYTSPSPRD